MNKIATLLIVLFLFCFGTFSTSFAQCISTSATNGTVFGTLAYSGSSYQWNNPSFVATTDASSAKASATVSIFSGYTEYLKVSGFHFNIPAFSQICGVVVSITRKATEIGLGSNANDNTVKLVVGGSVAGNNKASNTAWSGSSTTVIYGGPADLWGLSLSANDVNSENFGVAFAADLAGLVTLQPSAHIDNINVTVYYNPPSNITLPLTLASFQSSLYGSTASNTWVMAEQENNAGITLERKKDQGEWINLKTYGNLKKGAGVLYRYNDDLKGSGTYFYRLKFTSTLGNVTYSKTNSVVYSSHSPLQVFPSPAKSQLSLSNATAAAGIVVCNSMGQRMNVPVQWLAEGAASLNVAGLTSGLYYLQNGNKTVAFLKQ